MKTAGLLLLSAFAASAADPFCRKVKQEEPKCAKKTRKVKKRFAVYDIKQICRTEKKTKTEYADLILVKDVCHTAIVEVKNKHPVKLNNKVCESVPDKAYGDKKASRPKCKIVKEVKYVYSSDKIAKVTCKPKSEKKRVPVVLHYKEEYCKPEKKLHFNDVTFDITETKCHVRYYDREVCDDGKGGSYFKNQYDYKKNDNDMESGHYGEVKATGYDNEGYKAAEYGGEKHEASGYGGDEYKATYDGYGGGEYKAPGYGGDDHKDGGDYMEYNKGAEYQEPGYSNPYGNIEVKANGYGGGDYNTHEADGYGGGEYKATGHGGEYAADGWDAPLSY